MADPKILAFAGATRIGSWNKKLLAVGVYSLRAAGADVTVVDLRDFPMPLYDGDTEKSAGLPAPARELKQLMIAHAGFLLSCPEYNSSITAVLKNTIDWISRPQPDEAPAIAFRGKVVGLLAASPGNLGGIRGLFTVRQILTVLGAITLPTQFGLARASEAFDDSGALKDGAHQRSVDSVVAELVRVVGRLTG